MRAKRLFLACCIAACMAVPLASPAMAQEEPCPDTWFWDTVGALVPSVPEQFVELGEGKITIRGDLATAAAARLADHYRNALQTFVTCAQDLALGSLAPYEECVRTEAAPILASPDPVGRYLTVGSDLVVTIDYGLALDDAIAIFNCNGIVTSGG